MSNTLNSLDNQALGQLIENQPARQSVGPSARLVLRALPCGTIDPHPPLALARTALPAATGGHPPRPTSNTRACDPIHGMGRAARGKGGSGETGSAAPGVGGVAHV
jgi:hypothetical protein